MMQIDHSSNVPLHFQVEQLIRDMLKETQYREGALLPPESLMAQQLSISRNTVRAAISRLVQEGLLERKAGRGTRYVQQSLQTDLSGWPSFTMEMKKQGVIVELFAQSVERMKPDKTILQALGLPSSDKDEKMIKMSRTRGHAGVPAVHSISWFHPRTRLTVDENFSQPLYEVIQEKSGLSAIYSEEKISAVIADAELSEWLHCELGDPILVRSRIVKTSQKQCLEFNINYYRADKFTYELTLQASQ